jgi:hypothetical protein
MGTVKYFGYDKNIDINVCPEDTMEVDLASHLFGQQQGTPSKATPCSGISISSTKVPRSAADLTTSRSRKAQDSYAFTIKLRGLGTVSEDGFARGDVNLRINLDP